MPLLGEIVQLAERGVDFAGQHGPAEFENLALRGEAEHREHVGFLDLVAAKADELVERRLRRRACRRRRRGRWRRAPASSIVTFSVRRCAQVLDDERGGNAAQVEALAAGEDRGQDLFRVGGGEDELHVRRRLFERLEQRVERRVESMWTSSMM